MNVSHLWKEYFLVNFPFNKWFFSAPLREAAKKVIFFSGPGAKALPPTPLELKKKFFFSGPSPPHHS